MLNITKAELNLPEAFKKGVYVYKPNAYKRRVYCK